MNTEKKIVKSNHKCPKCKSTDIFFVELWKDHAIYFHIEEGSTDLKGGSLEVGNPYKVQGNCNVCRHGWTFRNAKQITDLFTKLKHNEHRTIKKDI